MPPSTSEPNNLALTTWRTSGAITDAVHTEAELTPEDYLWETLPGRCCFSGRWDDVQDPPAWVSVDDCSECTVWGQADASCHLGPDTCKQCGMDLYCPGKPPPLLGGAKVCTGASRVGEGCMDSLKMGVCMDKSLNDCMEACLNHATCESVVYYPEEQKGSCVLCGDMHHMVSTPKETTRIYERVNHPPPPAPDGTQQHFECTFVPHVEFSVDSPLGYANENAPTRFECCTLCGLHAGCQDFVYQHSTGLCVLLPHVASKAEIRRLPNPNVISGSLTITSVRPTQLRHGTCSFQPASSFTGGDLGVAETLDTGGGKPIATRQDCCDACLAEERCGKFSFQPDLHLCTLYEPYAEAFSTDGLISGVLGDRYSSASSASLVQAEAARSGGGLMGGGAPGAAAIAAGAGESAAAGLLYGTGGGRGSTLQSPWQANGNLHYDVGMPPMPPTLAGATTPPPAPPPIASKLTQRVMSVLSLSIFVLMVGGFLLCAYCFFSQDLKRLAGMRAPPAGAMPLASTEEDAARAEEKEDEDEVDDEADEGVEGGRRGSNKRGGKGGGKGGKGSRAGRREDNPERASVSVTVVMRDVSQTKEVAASEVAACADRKELTAMLMDLFPAVLRNARKEAVLLQCRRKSDSGRGSRGSRQRRDAPPAGNGKEPGSSREDGWLLVTNDSAWHAVIKCRTMRLIERPPKKAYKLEDYTIAFPPGCDDDDGTTDAEAEEDDDDAYEVRAAEAARKARKAQVAAEAAAAEAAARRRMKHNNRAGGGGGAGGTGKATVSPAISAITTAEADEETGGTVENTSCRSFSAGLD